MSADVTDGEGEVLVAIDRRERLVGAEVLKPGAASGAASRPRAVENGGVLWGIYVGNLCGEWVYQLVGHSFDIFIYLIMRNIYVYI